MGDDKISFDPGASALSSWSRIRKELFQVSHGSTKSIGIIGDSRTGTTFLFAWLASMLGDRMSAGDFQPWKAMLRHGTSIQVPSPRKGIWLWKDTLGPKYPGHTKEGFAWNFVRLQLQKGIKPEDMHLIVLGRDPVHTLFSWMKFTPDTGADIVRKCGMSKEELIRRLEALHISHTVFDYELLADGPLEVLQSLLDRIPWAKGIQANLHFDLSNVMERIRWNEADPEKNPDYWNAVVLPAIQKGLVQYRPPLPIDQAVNKLRGLYAPDVVERLERELQLVATGLKDTYEEFAEKSRNMLGR